MRSFRFPRFAIFLMLASFLTLLAALGLVTEMSRTVQMGYLGAPNLQAMWWAKLTGMFAKALMILWAAGAVGYAFLFALRRSGLHRLTNLEPRPPEKL